MDDIVSLAVLFGFVYIILPRIIQAISRRVGSSVPAKLPYHSKYILTGPEYRFYTALKPLMTEHNYLICPKVGLKDLFEVNKGADRQKYFRQISQKHIDFLICDAQLHPLFAIELDDKSHNRSDVKQRDKFKDVVFSSAGLPLYRVPTASTYTEEYLKNYIHHLT